MKIGAEALIELTENFGAHNYHPLPIVTQTAEGVWITDVDGRRYLDCQSAYSANSFGHRHPRLVAAAKRQLDRLTLVSRAFYTEELAYFSEELAKFCRLDVVLPMNTGAEAVETAVKCARKWGYEVKGIAPDCAEVITFSGNFHGRTVTIASFSDSKSTYQNFGPLTPGFKIVPYGDLEALRSAISKNTCAILLEPIQGEGGVIIPPNGWLSALRKICTDERIVFIDDEVQTGMCRTGRDFCVDWEGVTPDLLVLGKALGGGIMPVSAVVGRREFMEVFKPGTHGSTFGGNPLACAIGREVLKLIREDGFSVKSAEQGAYFLSQLMSLKLKKVSAIRGRGLFLGVDVKPEFGPAYGYCEKLLALGLLCKDTRTQTVRFAPPLTISRAEIDLAIEKIAEVLG